MNELQAEVLVVGGGTGGTAAAIQAARRGAQTILVSETPWLGGMLTAAGVSAPDGNELVAFQTGLWGAFVRELRRRQPTGLDHAWVSFFTYDPRIGAEIFADWVLELPNLLWISGRSPTEVLKQGSSITGVRFADLTVQAAITIDGTELGDLLALADVPHRWGWEWQSEWDEPSAPVAPNDLTQRYPVQAPTWVVVMQDFGEGGAAEIAAPPIEHPEQFAGAWEGYGGEKFLNYGRLPENRFMINWPQRGNDYGEGVQRLVQSPQERSQFLQEARWHSQSFARFIQTQLGRRYGLAVGLFPRQPGELGGGAFALHPYYRESRRLVGRAIVREQDILPMAGGRVAALPVDQTGVTAIAVGNYANDHHYATIKFPVKPKSIRWGGRWTGTPFTLPYGSLVATEVNGLLVCDKNMAVSHIANGATRLQPTVLGVGQAAGMAAALCVERGCQPRELPIRELQEALLLDRTAPSAVIPLFNVAPAYPEWLTWQRYYLDRPDAYPLDGNVPSAAPPPQEWAAPLKSLQQIRGKLQLRPEQGYTIVLAQPIEQKRTLALVTLRSEVYEQLQTFAAGQPLKLWGRANLAGQWFLVDRVMAG